jgi:hypothetical protein
MTVFKNLYAFNHKFYVVTTDPQSIPERRWILSNGFKAEEREQNEPDEHTLAIVSPTEVRQLFGSFASVMDGVSVIIFLKSMAEVSHRQQFIQTDGPQFLRHMYHFVVGQCRHSRSTIRFEIVSRDICSVALAWLHIARARFHVWWNHSSFTLSMGIPERATARTY